MRRPPARHAEHTGARARAFSGVTCACLGSHSFPARIIAMSSNEKTPKPPMTRRRRVFLFGAVVAIVVLPLVIYMVAIGIGGGVE